MLEVKAERDVVRVGRHFAVSFQRTLRIPDDGGTYPLPPGLGGFPVCRVDDYADRVPEAWREEGGYFIPMYQREALWLSFTGAHWRPNAVKVGVGQVNAVTGDAWSERLRARAQDYLVCPDQPWLDGINAGDGFIRQFVAMPLGMGYTVEAEVTGEEQHGGMQLVVVEPKPGRFPERPPRMDFAGKGMVMACAAPTAPPGTEMGLGAGGRMEQEIFPDAHGIDTWDESRSARVAIHIANSMTFREITGREPPPTPVSARTYAQHGLPWFELYDEGRGGVAAAERLAKVRSVKEIDEAKGFRAQQDDEPVEVGEHLVVKLGGGGVAKAGLTDRR
ncbi:MAG: hypothetical protein ACR2NV_07985 [Thermoleophilaceae bacterium]